MTPSSLNRMIVELRGGCWHECGPGPRGDFKDPPPYACPKCGKSATGFPFNTLYCSPEIYNPDFSLPKRFLDLMDWLMEPVHARAEVTCPNYIHDDCPGLMSECEECKGCTLCHGKGRVWVREWGWIEFLAWAHQKNGFRYQSHFTFPLQYIKQPAFFNLVGEWLETLIEKEGG